VSDFEIRAARPDDLSDIGEVTVQAYRGDGFLGDNERVANCSGVCECL
jgi:hypothetical protein